MKNSRPNIVLIIIDTLRADSLGCYGSERSTSPFIDAFAQRSTLYERAISAAPWTVPSFASIFTGMYPSDHGVDINHPILDGTYRTMTEQLHTLGYRTMGITCNAWIGRETKHDRGFDDHLRMWQLIQSTSDLSGKRLRAEFANNMFDMKIRLKVMMEGNPVVNFMNAVYTKVFYRRYDFGARKSVREAKKFLSTCSKSEQPFFLNINFFEPHLPYRPPSPFMEKFLPSGVTKKQAMSVPQDPWGYVVGDVPMNKNDFEILRCLYDAEVAYQDFRVNEVLTMLKSHGLIDNSIIIVTADHGENIGHHNLMDHQYCLYNSLLHVPLIISWPGEAGGQRNGQLVQTIDLYKTLMAALGVELDEPLAEQLRLTHSFFPSDNQPRELAFSEYPSPQPTAEVMKRRYPKFEFTRLDRSLQCVQNKTEKFIWSSNNNHEFYDIVNDKGELNNLFSSNQHSHHLTEAIEKFKSQIRKEKVEDAHVDENIRQMMRNLGYL